MKKLKKNNKPKKLKIWTFENFSVLKKNLKNLGFSKPGLCVVRDSINF